MAQPEQKTDAIFVDLYDELGELARDFKAFEFRFRKIARKLMQRRAVYQRALETIGIKFVDSTARKEQS